MRPLPLPSRPASPTTSRARSGQARRPRPAALAAGASPGASGATTVGLRRASGHGGDEIVDGERAAPAHRRHPAVAQDGAAVGDRHDLVELMRDVDDRGALRLHAREHREQPLDLAFFQRRRRLVQDEDAALPAQRLGDRDELPLGEAERSDRPVGVGRQSRAGPARRAPRRACARDRPAASGPNRRTGRSPSAMFSAIDSAGTRRSSCGMVTMPAAMASRGLAKCRAAPSTANRAAVGTPDAAENADQRGFAGAVLADDGMDFAGADVEVDAVERDRRAEMLGHALGAGGRSGSCAINAARTRPASFRR